MLNPLAVVAITGSLIGGAASQMRVDIASVTLSPQAAAAINPIPARPGEQPSRRACIDARRWLLEHGVVAEGWLTWRQACSRFHLPPAPE